MNGFIFQVFQSIALLLTGMVLFVGVLFVNPSILEVLATPLTPEAAQYEIDRADNPAEAAENIKQQAQTYTRNELPRDTEYTTQALKNRTQEMRNKTQELSDRASNASDKLVDKTQNKLQEAAETVREKLNLDEPLPPSTKEFLSDVKQNVDDAVYPITKTSGYYTIPR